MIYNALYNKVYQTEMTLHAHSNELDKKKHELTTMKSQLASIDTEPVSQAEMRKAINGSLVMQQYSVKLAELDQRINQYKNTSNPNSPRQKEGLDRMEEEKKGLQESAKNAENTIRPQIEQELRAGMQEKLEQDIRKLEGNVSGLQAEVDNSSKQLQNVQAQFNALNPANFKGGIVVERLRDDVEQIKTTQARLASEVALLKAEPSTSSKILVLQGADNPAELDYSRLLKLGTAGGFGAFALVLFGIAMLEFRSRKISGADEVVHGLSLPLVGTMPELPARARRPVHGAATGQDLYWQSIITESVDAIRTQLLHAARTDAVHVVMVTSADSGEGKTSLASQLAASLARASRKTLLVDGDLRNPAAHKLFDLPLQPGLCEVLRGEIAVDDAVRPTLLAKLGLLAAGRWDMQATQALALDGVQTTFDHLREHYDFIIVDSCPVLPVADAQVLGQHVDAVILSVLREVSRMPALHTAQRRLQGLGIRVLGAVVIGADSGAAKSAYSKYLKG
jgi:capsular exopolysaccharide synthesis family protein